ncbi:hypothetical protein SCHPADRAFT_254721 [Schizopora paradoxa]|uniref:Uncharacterized protein n=1 Tax=Schizopora paradoxa TaxID=27342 RepID=A0A0H2RVG3_9AGAM|nr:hypothetical protein SCHPADRAFT_254721 [Schizopora paradoxa]
MCKGPIKEAAMEGLASDFLHFESLSLCRRTRSSSLSRPSSLELPPLSIPSPSPPGDADVLLTVGAVAFSTRSASSSSSSKSTSIGSTVAVVSDGFPRAAAAVVVAPCFFDDPADDGGDAFTLPPLAFACPRGDASLLGAGGERLSSSRSITCAIIVLLASECVVSQLAWCDGGWRKRKEKSKCKIHLHQRGRKRPDKAGSEPLRYAANIIPQVGRLASRVFALVDGSFPWPHPLPTSL